MDQAAVPSTPHPTVVSVLAHRLRAHRAQGTALTVGSRAWTWSGLRDAAASVDRTLTESGAAPRSPVAVLAENEADPIVALLAAVTRGSCVLLLSARTPADELTAALADAAPRAVVLGGDTARRDPALVGAAGGDGRAVLTVDDGRAVVEKSSRAGPRVSGHDGPVRPDVLLELRSGGTTGRPKRIQLTDRQVLASLRSSEQLEARPSARPTLVSHPIEHIAGLWSLLGGLSSGRPVVVLPRFDPHAWARAVAAHGIRATFLVPAAIAAVLDAEVPVDQVASLSLVTTGAAACPTPVATAFTERYGVPVLT
ncbi:MAG: AMP-binding protein, partial [Dermatophilaceae bacterium]